MSAPDDDKSLRNRAQRADDDKYIAEYLETAKQKFDEGNKAVVLMAMHQCLLMKKPLPEWLRLEFIKAYESATAFKIRSWDEAFGEPHKGAHLGPRKRYAKLRYDIALRVALRAPDENIDPGLFETIARELNIEGVKATTASDIYYKHGGKELTESIEPLVPFLREQLRKNLSTAQPIEAKQNSRKI
jgi:hypothetical protein